MNPISYTGLWLRNQAANLFGFSSNGNIQEGVDGYGFFRPIGNNRTIITLQDYKDFNNAFFNCSTLQTVIINKGQCKANATWDLYKIGSEKPSNNPYASAVKAKMQKPNYMQNYVEFRMDVNNLVQTHGFCIIWFVPNGLTSIGTGFQNIWAINPADIVITYKPLGKYIYQNNIADVIDNIKLNYSGGQINIPLEEIEFVFDQTAKLATDGLVPPFIPASRIYGLKMIISNNMAAYDARNSLATDRGQTGFIANDTKDAASFIPLQANEKEQLQKELAQYGLLRGQKKQVITDKNLKWISTVIPTKDLMLFEETEETMCRIVDVYGYQIQLLATSKTSSIGSQNETQKEARKNLYQNTIIPEDKTELPAIFKHFNLENEGLEVRSSYAHVEEMQENETEKEATRTARIDNIAKINAMPVQYDQKINIACEVLEISNEEASKIISNDTTSQNNPSN